MINIFLTAYLEIFLVDILLLNNVMLEQMSSFDE